MIAPVWSREKFLQQLHSGLRAESVLRESLRDVELELATRDTCLEVLLCRTALVSIKKIPGVLRNFQRRRRPGD